MYKMVITQKTGVTCYGIRVGQMIIEDISTDRDAVKELLERCNRGRLDADCLWDVVQDWVDR